MDLGKNLFVAVRVVPRQKRRRASIGKGAIVWLAICLMGCAGDTDVATSDNQPSISLQSTTGSSGVKAFGYLLEGGKFLFAQWNCPCQDNFVIYSFGKDNPRPISQGTYAIDGAPFKSTFSTRDAAIASSPGFIKSDDGTYILPEMACLGAHPKMGQSAVCEMNTWHVQATLVHSTEEHMTNSVLLLQDKDEVTDGDPSLERVLSLGDKVLVRRRIREGEGIPFDLSVAGFALSQGGFEGQPPR
jgi:hypothetical protein